MTELTLKAPAKLNLCLDIVGRQNGYHLLEMINQTIDLYDLVTLSSAQDISVCCDDVTVPTGVDNLACRAAQAFFTYTKHLGGVQIGLQKRIPHGSGLGGGSADAAAVLKGLNRLYRTRLTVRELCEIGLSVGADVPFCLVGGTALVTGIGERIIPLERLMSCYFVVAKPPVSVCTKDAFEAYDTVGSTEHPDINQLIAALYQKRLQFFSNQTRNVLEAAIQLPEIEAIRQTMLSGGALGSRMTGSGSAVFGIFKEKRLAADCVQMLEDGKNQVYLCKPCTK